MHTGPYFSAPTAGSSGGAATLVANAAAQGDRAKPATARPVTSSKEAERARSEGERPRSQGPPPGVAHRRGARLDIWV